MAILDPRLLPFIEVLAELGMDWLAFELVDGVRRGKEPVEDEAALRRARDRTRRASDAGEDKERFGSPGGAATPFWATINWNGPHATWTSGSVRLSIKSRTRSTPWTRSSPASTPGRPTLQWPRPGSSSAATTARTPSAVPRSTVPGSGCPRCALRWTPGFCPNDRTRGSDRRR